jgi:hypothetical protein
MSLDVLAAITPDMARELAESQHVCTRPLLRRVEDRQTGNEDVVAIACGSTRETVCPPCAHKARLLRIQQCREGWHRADEPHDQSEQDHGADSKQDQPDGAEDDGDTEQDQPIQDRGADQTGGGMAG